VAWLKAKGEGGLLIRSAPGCLAGRQVEEAHAPSPVTRGGPVHPPGRPERHPPRHFPGRCPGIRRCLFASVSGGCVEL